MGFIITSQRYKKNIYKETFFMTHNDLLQKPSKNTNNWNQVISKLSESLYANKLQIESESVECTRCKKKKKKIFQGHWRTEREG